MKFWDFVIGYVVGKTKADREYQASTDELLSGRYYENQAHSNTVTHSNQFDNKELFIEKQKIEILKQYIKAQAEFLPIIEEVLCIDTYEIDDHRRKKATLKVTGNADMLTRDELIKMVEKMYKTLKKLENMASKHGGNLAGIKLMNSHQENQIIELLNKGKL